MGYIKMRKILLGAAIAAVTMFGAISAQASTTFDFTSLGLLLGPFGTTQDGITVGVTGGSFTDGGTVTPGGVLVGTSVLGIGILNGLDDPQIDGFLGNDVAIFNFSEKVELNSVTFGFFNGNDDFTLFVDVSMDGALEVQGFSFDTGSDTYNFAAGYISDLFGIGARASNDEFTIKSLTVTAVPLPPAVLLFGGALVGLGWLTRRRKLAAQA